MCLLLSVRSWIVLSAEVYFHYLQVSLCAHEMFTIRSPLFKSQAASITRLDNVFGANQNLNQTLCYINSSKQKKVSPRPLQNLN